MSEAVKRQRRSLLTTNPTVNFVIPFVLSFPIMIEVYMWIHHMAEANGMT